MAGVKTVSFDYDCTDFEKAIDQNVKQVTQKSKEIIVASATQFAAGAATFTPPSRKKAVIEKKFWTRPVVFIPTLIKNGTATKQDIQMLRRGYSFKVLNTKRGTKKNVAFAYCKKLSQIKKLAKIASRGLSRVMWGKEMNKINAKVPTVINSILKKSPLLRRINENEVELKVLPEGIYQVAIVNNVGQIESYASFAVNEGYKRAQKSIYKQLKKIAQKEQTI